MPLTLQWPDVTTFGPGDRWVRMTAEPDPSSESVQASDVPSMPLNSLVLDAVVDKAVSPKGQPEIERGEAVAILHAIADWGQLAQVVPPKAFTSPKSSLERRFNRLKQTWRAFQGVSSSISRLTNHPAYRAIIALGMPAVPLILNELKREPDHWFTALKQITGNDPVPIRSRGRIREMVEAWLQWGRARGVRI